ncbi:MAG: arsenate reductase ArsC [Hyphomicrobiaceae bacterium]|nr:arsenate reductase ArsC [Hyphomicrobiaceae bacterium]
MTARPYTVLFLCTHNSARSVLAESILNAVGKGLFKAYSAGSTPRGTVNPLALTTLAERGHDVSGLRSKSWDAFAATDAPRFDFIFTLCDDAAAETCPVWPGHPTTGHWGMPDPSRTDGGQEGQRAAFSEAYARLDAHLRDFVELARASDSVADLKTRLAPLAERFHAVNRVPYGGGA